MKISEKPTDYILVTARCNSEWDSCDFAIISGGKSWARWLQTRLEAAQAVQNHDDFFCLKFFDTSVEFYISNEEMEENMFEEIEGKSWAFVELENEEEETFSKPENRLDCYTISLFSNGFGKYIAYGKHTGEEFYTERIPFTEILRLYTGTDAG
jgi:hypothetical protein